MTDDREIETLLDAMARDLAEYLAGRGFADPALVGIHTGGAWVAEALRRRMGVAEELGTLDISFYRDDFSRIGMHPDVRPSHLPFAVDDRHIVLVDDVLYTGRTIRAALNEIFDYGRPASVTLAVLVERNGRELPVEAAVVGRRLSLQRNEHVKLGGPEPLTLTIQQTP